MRILWSTTSTTLPGSYSRWRKQRVEVLRSPPISPVSPCKFNFDPQKMQFWVRSELKFVFVYFFDWGVLWPWGQCVWTLFCMIFSGIPHSTRFGAALKIPKYSKYGQKWPFWGPPETLGTIFDGSKGVQMVPPYVRSTLFNRRSTQIGQLCSPMVKYCQI